MTTVVRAATRDDVPSLTALAAASVRELQRDDYPPELLERAIREVYGVDTTLIEDGTYFVIEGADGIVACGGWSKRKTLCGGDHWTQRDDEFLDPAVDAAKIRAFYVRPDRARRAKRPRRLPAFTASRWRRRSRAFGFTSVAATSPSIARCCRFPVATVSRSCA
jgi:hypothetical protein